MRTVHRPEAYKLGLGLINREEDRVCRSISRDETRLCTRARVSTVARSIATIRTAATGRVGLRLNANQRNEYRNCTTHHI